MLDGRITSLKATLAWYFSIIASFVKCEQLHNNLQSRKQNICRSDELLVHSSEKVEVKVDLEATVNDLYLLPFADWRAAVKSQDLCEIVV